MLPGSLVGQLVMTNVKLIACLHVCVHLFKQQEQSGNQDLILGHGKPEAISYGSPVYRWVRESRSVSFLHP